MDKGEGRINMAKKLGSFSFLNLLDEIEYEEEIIYDIFKKFELKNKFLADVDSFTNYEVKESELRWDILSNKFYGTPELWWVIALFNDITDPFQVFQTEGLKLKIIKPENIKEILLLIRKSKE